MHTPSSTTTYQLTVTQYGCSATDNVTVVVNDAPVVGVSGGSSQAACQGGSLTLSGTGASSYTWNNGVVDGQSFAAPANTTTYTVTGTDANGCSNTAQVTVSITSLLNWANLQHPATETYSCNGGQVAIYGQVYEPGITDGPGQGSGISVEYGYSTTVPIHPLGPIGIRQPIMLTLETTMNTMELFLRRFIIYQQQQHITTLLDISLLVAIGNTADIMEAFGMGLPM